MYILDKMLNLTRLQNSNLESPSLANPLVTISHSVIHFGGIEKDKARTY